VFVRLFGMMYFLSSFEEFKAEEGVLGDEFPVCLREILARFLMP
jgi:hypothetical protein